MPNFFKGIVMKMKDVVKAFSNFGEDKFLNKVDKEIEKLYQLRYIAKVISLAKEASYEILSDKTNLNKVIKFSIENLGTCPQTWGMVYNIEGKKGSFEFREHDLDKLSKGIKKITNHKLFECATKGFVIDYALEERLILNIIGEDLFNEYFELTEELKEQEFANII